MAGIPEFGIHFLNPDFAKFAEACGGFGVRVDDPRDAHDAVRAAIASGKPAIVDAIVEPNELPFPPKIERGQATGYGIAFLREVFEGIKE
ncbi:Pyruvate dehydrogenase [ubiquinone] [compost metagenome]